MANRRLRPSGARGGQERPDPAPGPGSAHLATAAYVFEDSQAAGASPHEGAHLTRL